jgi:hypothetical protein
VRFGVDDREAPTAGSSGGAEGERIAARECGEGIVAVRALCGAETDWELCCRLDCSGDAEKRCSHQETGGAGSLQLLNGGRRAFTRCVGQKRVMFV